MLSISVRKDHTGAREGSVDSIKRPMAEKTGKKFSARANGRAPQISSWTPVIQIFYMRPPGTDIGRSPPIWAGDRERLSIKVQMVESPGQPSQRDCLVETSEKSVWHYLPKIRISSMRRSSKIDAPAVCIDLRIEESHGLRCQMPFPVLRGRTTTRNYTPPHTTKGKSF